jgi:hypothetical protein
VGGFEDGLGGGGGAASIGGGSVKRHGDDDEFGFLGGEGEAEEAGAFGSSIIRVESGHGVLGRRKKVVRKQKGGNYHSRTILPKKSFLDI